MSATGYEPGQGGRTLPMTAPGTGAVVETSPEDEELQWAEDEFGKYRLNDEVWTMNQIRDHPLFMEDMPRDISDNPNLLALQSLIYDGQSQEEMAEHFKKMGNEAFRISPATPVSAQNALACYTKALEMECENKALNSQLHSNRAAISLRLNEYHQAVNDCRVALRLDPDNHKASYRGAKACEAQGLTLQALAFVSHSLRYKPDEKELVDMKKRLELRLKREEQAREHDRQLLEKAAEEQRAADLTAKLVLEAGLVHLGPPMWDMTQYCRGAPPQPRLAREGEDEAGDGKAIVWALLLLYDETSQSDFVECFDDRCALEEQLQVMFPSDSKVDWDEDGKYTWDRLVVYLECYAGMEGKATHLVKLATDSRLMEQLKGRRVPPSLILHVFVADTPAHSHFCSDSSRTFA